MLCFGSPPQDKSSQRWVGTLAENRTLRCCLGCCCPRPRPRPRTAPGPVLASTVTATCVQHGAPQTFQARPQPLACTSRTITAPSPTWPSPFSPFVSGVVPPAWAWSIELEEEDCAEDATIVHRHCLALTGVVPKKSSHDLQRHSPLQQHRVSYEYMNMVQRAHMEY